MSKKRVVRKKVRPRFHRRTPPGALPGTLAADPGAAQPEIRVIAYGPDEFVEEEIHNLDRLPTLVGKHPVTWVNVAGLGDAAAIGRLGEIFGLHVLALEDVVNTHQRAKVEEYGDHLYVVARIVHLAEHLQTEQVSLFVGKNFVVSFQEHRNGCMAPVVERLQTARGRIRETRADYLAYAILDAAIDSYFPVLEQFGERLDALDDRVSARNAGEAMTRIHEVRSDLLLLRRAIWPHREALNMLARDTNPLIADETRIFLRDCYDHSVQLIDLLETYREMCADLRDVCLSLISNRMNEIMKVLTVIATIFMPLSFLASLYGINFDTQASPWNMPELRWRWGYPFALGLMAAATGGMLLYFYRRGWLGAADELNGTEPNREKPP